MEEEFKSEGKCLFCESKFPQKEIGKHLGTHLTKMEKEDAGDTQKKFCHIEVEAAEMFLHLLVRGNLTMKSIDRYLRKIWLDCCGHLSNFGHKNYRISTKERVEDVFQPRVKIFHDYDYGTTTRVFLRARKHYSLNLSEDIILLSRNEPLKLMCVTCRRKPAINICSVCLWDDYAFFCEKCSANHSEICADFEDYAEMPVVNSPRMGECGYSGGEIDTERDGPYRK